MGSISIGIKRRPRGKISTHIWNESSTSRDHFIALDNRESDIVTIKEFCDRYTDPIFAASELEKYKSRNCKFIISTRCFSFGKTAKEARQDHLKGSL